MEKSKRVYRERRRSSRLGACPSRAAMALLVLSIGCDDRRADDRPEAPTAAVLACPPEELRISDPELQGALVQIERESRDANARRDFSVLGWIAQRDERPLIVESALLWVHEVSAEVPERWLLIDIARNPGRPWRIDYSLDSDRPAAFRELEHAPTIADAESFIEESGWTFLPSRDFRRTGAGVCRDAWVARLGEPPPGSFAIRGPDFLTDTQRRSLAYHVGATARITGRVLGADGSPVAGATVVPELVREDGCCALSDRVTTGADGSFALSIDPELDYALRITAPDGTTRKRVIGRGEHEVSVRLPSESHWVTLTLHCERRTGLEEGAEVRVYMGETTAAGDLVDLAHLWRWGDDDPAVRLSLPHGATRVTVASACGVVDRPMEITSHAPITISVDARSAHRLTLVAPDAEGGIGCVQIASDRYGSFGACPYTERATFHVPAGEYHAWRPTPDGGIFDGASGQSISVFGDVEVQLQPRP